jgi:2-oxoacid:acceptor oxidoreductase gamma subunit (pyruvate/2-ketoisovalerate family)
MAFTRVGDEFIYLRTGITEPDIVVVLDPTVMGAVDVSSGLKEDGLILANTSKSKEELIEQFSLKHRLAIVNANLIAREEIGRPITNTTMMGALVKATGLVELDSLAKEIEHRFPGIADKNISAMRRAYEETEL